MAPTAPGFNSAPKQAHHRGRNDRATPSVPPPGPTATSGLPSRPGLSYHPSASSVSRASSSSAASSSSVLPPLRFFLPTAIPAPAMSSGEMPAPLRFSLDSGLTPVQPLPAPPQPLTPLAPTQPQPHPPPARLPQPGSSRQHKPTPSSTPVRPIKPLPSRTSSSTPSNAAKASSTPTPPAPPRSFITKDHLPPGYASASLWGDTAIACYDTEYIGPNPRFCESSAALGHDGYAREVEYTLYAQSYDERAAFLGFLELPCAYNKEWIEFRDPSREDLSNIVADSDFKASRKVQDDVRGLSWHLYNKYKVAECLLRLILHKDVLPGDSLERKIITETSPPLLEAKRMMGCWLVLRDETLKSMADFVISMRAWQRYARTISAFLNFVGAMVDSVDRATFRTLFPSELEKADYFVRRLKRHSLDSRYRGVIFVSKDATTYQKFFRQRHVPTYVRVTVDALDVNGGIPLSSTSAPRCSLEISESMTYVKQRNLPLHMYPPQNAEWQLCELLWRGILPRNDAYKSSESVEARKRKLSNFEQDRKRHRAAGDAKEAARREKFNATESDMGTSFEVYEWVAENSPGARHYLEQRGTARPLDMPQPMSDYAEAEEQIINHLHYLPLNCPNPATYLPPVHLFLGFKSDERLAIMMANLSWLLPILLFRIPMARRPGSAIKRFRTRDWKNILWGKGWEKEDFWEKGGKMFFGGNDEELAYARNHSKRPPFGELLCGCDATAERLTGDRTMARNIVFALHQWHLLLFLPNLADPAKLEKAGVPGIEEQFEPVRVNNYTLPARDAVVHYTPDFRFGFDVVEKSKAKQKKEGKGILLKIQDMVISDWGSVHPSGWLSEYTLENQANDTKRRVWLEYLAHILASSPHARALDDDKGTSEGWWSTSRLKAYNGHQQIAGGRETEDELQRHLFLRYVLTSLKAGQVPPEFLSLTETYEYGLCSKCRASSTVTMDYNDLSDEEADDYEFAREKYL
ncbi:hypothetical protein PENSPDRAFT_694469 [Peniophora sp. CONT]|nr:hypothetical protein PENSPDRAFT_694469 [Peniophora sp. CONT]